MNRRWLQCVGISVFAIAIRLASLPWHPVPTPSVQDEFSYRLGGETFASGRLTNPPHPLWKFFETEHVISRPFYASKYPPLQAAALAIGVIAGNPWLGVLLTVGILCGLLTWTLQGWLPPAWAFVGGTIAALRLGAAGSYWIDSYWGGAIAAAGGALVIGALPRLREKNAGWLPFAAGVLILVHSRPLEGMLLVVLVAAALGRSGAPRVLLVVAASLATVLVYNHLVTGNALLLPYTVHERQYASSTAFWWLPLPPEPAYNHDSLRRYWEWDRSIWQIAHDHPIAAYLFCLNRLLQFFAGGVWLALPLVVLAWLREPRVRLAAGLLGIFLGLMFFERAAMPHYVAPATGLFLVVLTAGLRGFWTWNRAGKVTAVLVAGIWLSMAARPQLRPDFERYTIPEYAAARSRINNTLLALGGRHVVLIRTSDSHTLFEEWVYNGANIDNQAIIWARDRGPNSNPELFRYYAGRRFWLLEPDRKPAQPEEIR